MSSPVTSSAFWSWIFYIKDNLQLHIYNWILCLPWQCSANHITERIRGLQPPMLIMWQPIRKINLCNKWNICCFHISEIFLVKRCFNIWIWGIPQEDIILFIPMDFPYGRWFIHIPLFFLSGFYVKPEFTNLKRVSLYVLATSNIHSKDIYPLHPKGKCLLCYARSLTVRIKCEQLSSIQLEYWMIPSFNILL